MILTRPNSSHKESYEAMIQEWQKHEEIPTSPSALFRGKNFEEFLEFSDAEPECSEVGKVPATLFFALDAWGKILGAIHIRHSIDTPFLRESGGHIGYGIVPTERRKWYATEMLRLALIEARKIWLDRVMLGCYDDNIGSIRTIENNGGIIERYTEHKGKKSRVYWITLRSDVHPNIPKV